jgi:hypothetical protein
MRRLIAEDAPVDDQEGFWFRLVGGCRLHGTVPSALQDAPGSSRLVVCARRYSLVIFSDLRGWCRWAPWINQITACCISHRSTCCILFSDGHYELQRLLCCAAVVCCAFGWPAMVLCPSYVEGTDIQPKPLPRRCRVLPWLAFILSGVYVVPTARLIQCATKDIDKPTCVDGSSVPQSLNGARL